MKGEIQPENFKFLQPSIESSRLGLRNSAQCGSVYLFTTLYYQKSNRTMRSWGQVAIFNSMKIVLIEMTSESVHSKGSFIDHAYSSVEIRMQFECMHFVFFSLIAFTLNIKYLSRSQFTFIMRISGRKYA